MGIHNVKDTLLGICTRVKDSLEESVTIVNKESKFFVVASISWIILRLILVGLLVVYLTNNIIHKEDLDASSSALQSLSGDRDIDDGKDIDDNKVYSTDSDSGTSTSIKSIAGFSRKNLSPSMILQMAFIMLMSESIAQTMAILIIVYVVARSVIGDTFPKMIIKDRRHKKSNKKRDMVVHESPHDERSQKIDDNESIGVCVLIKQRFLMLLLLIVLKEIVSLICASIGTMLFIIFQISMVFVEMPLVIDNCDIKRSYVIGFCVFKKFWVESLIFCTAYMLIMALLLMVQSILAILLFNIPICLFTKAIMCTFYIRYGRDTFATHHKTTIA